MPILATVQRLATAAAASSILFVACAGEPPARLHRLQSFDGQVEVRHGERSMRGRVLFQRPGIDGPGTLQWLPGEDPGGGPDNVTLLADGRVVAFTDAQPRPVTEAETGAIGTLCLLVGWDRSPGAARDLGEGGYELTVGSEVYRVRILAQAPPDPHASLR